jgi:hypothetical protein
MEDQETRAALEEHWSGSPADELWKRYCIIVRISENWPPRPSWRALAAAGSGSSSTIGLISFWAWKYTATPFGRLALARGSYPRPPTGKLTFPPKHVANRRGQGRIRPLLIHPTS